MPFIPHTENDIRTMLEHGIHLAFGTDWSVAPLDPMQTLYAATMASAREYATLLALGIPRWRMALTVLAQSFWVGFFGLLVAALAIALIRGFSRASAKTVGSFWVDLTRCVLYILLPISVVVGLVGMIGDFNIVDVKVNQCDAALR